MQKRIFDLALAIPALILLFPLFILISITILLIDGRPIFFIQNRPGYKGVSFKILKFRTMRPATYKEDKYSIRRVTKLGKLLRSLSLDELPELLNVISGHMSLVGPRPLLEEYIPLYSLEQKKRHDLKPGITGWAQVNERNSISWDEKFALDLWYIKNQSVLLDFKILLLTIKKVLTSDGVNSSINSTMEKFNGNN